MQTAAFVALSTQTLRDDQWINIQARSLERPRALGLFGPTLPTKPTGRKTTQDFWAPSVIYDGTTYFSIIRQHRIYCHHHERGRTLAIATSSSPEGPFVDMGRPLLLGVGFEYIDPMAFDDPATGKRLLYWGSGFQPIKVQELAPDRLSFALGSKATDLIWPNPVKGAFPRLVEAAWVIYHDGYYFLFYSGDELLRPSCRIWSDGRALNLCIWAVRNTRGSEERPPQPDAIQKRTLAGARAQFGRGRRSRRSMDQLSRDRCGPASPATREDEINSRRVLLIDKIEWRDGWPHVGTPSDEPTKAPVASRGSGTD